MATDKKVAIVTGANSGIGLAVAKKLAEMGMCIVGTGRDVKKLEDTKAAVKDPDRVITLAADLTEKDAPKKLVDAALQKWGRIDFLINNAGVGKPRPLLECDDDMLDEMLNIMLRAPFRLAREALAHMKPSSGIVNVTSTFAVVGGMRGGAYSAAKAGLHGLTTHIACHYGRQGIRCNSVAPGVTLTPMVAGRLEDPKFKRVNVEMTPAPRLSTVEDTSSVIAFLCTPGAEMVNCQHIVVDGGWSYTKYLSDYAQTSVWTEAPQA